MAVYAADEGLEAGERAKKYAELAVVDATLRGLDNMGGTAEAAHKRRLKQRKGAGGAKLICRVWTGGGSKQVTRPERCGASDPDATLAAQGHAQEREGVGHKAGGEGTLTSGALSASRAGQDEVGRGAGCEVFG